MCKKKSLIIAAVIILSFSCIYLNNNKNHIKYFTSIDSLIASRISNEYQIINEFAIEHRTFYLVNNYIDNTPTFMLFSTIEQNEHFILEKSTVRLGLTNNTLSFGFSVDNIELQCTINKQGDKYIFQYIRT
ncbi:MAG: hypothetical protein RSF40_08280 [Oscillospiraceae bacterium]